MVKYDCSLNAVAVLFQFRRCNVMDSLAINFLVVGMALLCVRRGGSRSLVTRVTRFEPIYFARCRTIYILCLFSNRCVVALLFPLVVFIAILSPEDHLFLLFSNFLFVRGFRDTLYTMGLDSFLEGKTRSSYHAPPKVWWAFRCRASR